MKNYFQFVLNFIKNNKTYFIISFVFLLLFIFMYIATPIDENTRNMVLNSAKAYIQNIIVSNKFYLAWKIFLNNLIIGFFILISGFVFSLLGILLLGSNVFVVSIVFMVSLEKVGLFKTIFAILPHGILEIFAILASLALAFKITYLITKKIWKWKENKIGHSIKEIFYFRFIFIVPLFFIASIIEVFITPLFLK